VHFRWAARQQAFSAARRQPGNTWLVPACVRPAPIGGYLYRALYCLLYCLLSIRQAVSATPG